MAGMRHAPASWPPARIQAFDALLAGIDNYLKLQQLIQALNITDATILARRADLAALVTGTLLPAFKAA